MPNWQQFAKETQEDRQADFRIRPPAFEAGGDSKAEWEKRTADGGSGRDGAQMEINKKKEDVFPFGVAPSFFNDTFYFNNSS